MPPVLTEGAGGIAAGKGGGQERIRAGIDAVTTRDPAIRVAAEVAGNHGAILCEDFRAVASAVRGIAGSDRPAR